MRLVLALVCALAAIEPALAQKAAAKPEAGKYTPRMPDVSGQWGEGILKDAKVQSYDGKAYASIEFEKLEQHVETLCHYDKADEVIGKPIATIATFRQNMGWPALVDGRQIDLFKTPNEEGKTILPFILVDVTDFLKDVREDIYFQGCGGLNFKVCTVALYGHFEWRPAKSIPDWGADFTVGKRKCIFQLEHYRKMGIVDYGGAIAQASLDSFYAGLAVNAKGH